MPNHVTNEITIIGTDSEIKAIKDYMKTEENPFDFNNITKMPKILVGTKSPMDTITQEEYDRQELIIAVFEKYSKLEGDKLFDAINNDLKIPLTIEEQNKVKYFNFHGYSRCLTKKLREQAINECGYDNWYDWQRNAWGTKWNSYSHYGLDEEDEVDCTFGFQTAWSHPISIIQALSKKFPNNQFNIRFADEDTGYNVGEYSILGGEVIEDYFPEGGSDEAYELAIDINGGEYELYDSFFDYDEEDFVGNDYMETCLRLAIKEETLDEDIPTWLLHIALENCVEDENFEYAEKLKGFISLAEAKEK